MATDEKTGIVTVYKYEDSDEDEITDYLSADETPRLLPVPKKYASNFGRRIASHLNEKKTPQKTVRRNATEGKLMLLSRLGKYGGSDMILGTPEKGVCYDSNESTPNSPVDTDNKQLIAGNNQRIPCNNPLSVENNQFKSEPKAAIDVPSPSLSRSSSTSSLDSFVDEPFSSSGNENFSRSSNRNASTRSQSFPGYYKSGASAAHMSGSQESLSEIAKTELVKAKSAPAMYSAKSLFLRFSRLNLAGPCIITATDKPFLYDKEILPESIGEVLASYHTMNQRKRQGEIYEIIHTERQHCLAVLELVDVLSSKKAQPLVKEEPNLCNYSQQILNYHYSFLEKLKHEQKEGIYIEKIGAILYEHFASEETDDIEKLYGIISHYCKLAIHTLPPPTPQCVQSVPLRLTKYQTQLDALSKHSKDEGEEEQRLVSQALERVKKILTGINASVDEMEKKVRLHVIHDKMDSKSFLIFGGEKFGKSNLLENRKLLHEEKVKLKVADKYVPVVLLVLNDILLFIQETGNGRYQFYATQSTRVVASLNTYLVRDDAGTGDILYIISQLKQGLIFTVTTPTLKSRQTLICQLRMAISNYNKMKEEQHQIERENYVNDAEEYYEKFEQSVKNSMDKLTELSKCDTTSKHEIKQCYLNSKQLQTIALQKSKNLVDEILKDALNKTDCSETDLDKLTIKYQSLCEDVTKILPQLQNFLHLSLSLNESITEANIENNFESNFDFSEKIEQLRVQQLEVENEKRQNEERINAEHAELKKKQLQIEEKDKELKALEKHLEQREQRVLKRLEAMDKFFGASLNKCDRISRLRPANPSYVMESLVNDYLSCRHITLEEIEKIHEHDPAKEYFNNQESPSSARARGDKYYNTCYERRENHNLLSMVSDSCITTSANSRPLHLVMPSRVPRINFPTNKNSAVTFLATSTADIPVPVDSTSPNDSKDFVHKTSRSTLSGLLRNSIPKSMKKKKKQQQQQLLRNQAESSAQAKEDEENVPPSCSRSPSQPRVLPASDKLLSTAVKRIAPRDNVKQTIPHKLAACAI